MILSQDGVNYVAGFLHALIQVESSGSFGLVDLWERVSSDDAGFWSVWRKTTAPTLVKLELILAPVIWTELANGQVRALVPVQFRGLKAMEA